MVTFSELVSEEYKIPCLDAPLLPTKPAPEDNEFVSIAATTALPYQRSLRRAAAINAVVMARAHAHRSDEPFTQSDADVLMYITELLDKVAIVK